MNSRLIAFLVMTGAALGSVGCASNLTGDSYSREEARAVQQVQFGTVKHTRPVVIEGTKTPIGAGAGAAVGGIAGSTVGDGTSGQIGAVLGAVAGGLVGGATEEQVTKSQGIEVTVQLDDGPMIAVVQKQEPDVTFNVGERVRVLTVGGNTRVAH